MVAQVLKTLLSIVLSFIIDVILSLVILRFHHGPSFLVTIIRPQQRASIVLFSNQQKTIRRTNPAVLLDILSAIDPMSLAKIFQPMENIANLPTSVWANSFTRSVVTLSPPSIAATKPLKAVPSSFPKPANLETNSPSFACWSLSLDCIAAIWALSSVGLCSCCCANAHVPPKRTETNTVILMNLFTVSSFFCGSATLFCGHQATFYIQRVV